MFNKTPSAQAKRATETVADAPGRRSAPKPASILSADLVYEGRISGDGELHLEGVVRGDIEVLSLVVGEGATVEGGVKADTVEVRGRITGDIEARSVKLYASSRVNGDITHAQLSIEVGAVYQGRCRQFPAADRGNVIELETVQPATA